MKAGKVMRSSLSYRNGQSVGPTIIPTDVAAGVRTAPGGRFTILCDDREFGEYWPDAARAGHVAKKWSAIWPNHTYHVVLAR